MKIYQDRGRYVGARNIAFLLGVILVAFVSLSSGEIIEENTTAENINWETITPVQLEKLIVDGDLDVNKPTKLNNPPKDREAVLYPPIIKAAFSDNPDLLDVIVKYGGDVNGRISGHGQYEKYKFVALHLMARNGKLDMMERLLKLEADANLKDEDEGGDTPISNVLTSDKYKSSKQRKEAISLLVKHGAMLDFIRETGSERMKFNVLMYAVGSMIHYQTIDTYEGILPYLVSLGFDVNDYPEGNVGTVMNMATVSRLEDGIIQELIKLGGDVNLQNVFGITPIIAWVWWGNDILMFDYLIEQGADIDIKSKSKINYFLEQSININIKNNGGSILDIIDGRKRGDYDLVYQDYELSRHTQTQTYFASIEEFRSFGEKILNRIEMLCKERSYEICEELEERKKLEILENKASP